MNFISDDEITLYLTKIYHELKKHYNNNNILGIFTYGKINHKFAENKGDINISCIYIPTQEEMCLTLPQDTIINIENQQIKVIDIRLLKHLILCQDEIIMDNLSTGYKIINSKYDIIYNNYIYKNKDIICHYNNIKDLIEKDFNIDNIINEFILKVFQLSTSLNGIDFYNDLTKLEQDALKSLISELDENYTGYISISQLTQKHNISRPVYKNLFQKLENAQLAEISNKGVKGTLIKLLDLSIIENIK